MSSRNCFDDVSLADALVNRKIDGAAINLNYNEKIIKNHPFYLIDNLLITKSIEESDCGFCESSIEYFIFLLK